MESLADLLRIRAREPTARAERQGCQHLKDEPEPCETSRDAPQVGIAALFEHIPARIGCSILEALTPTPFYFFGKYVKVVAGKGGVGVDLTI